MVLFQSPESADDSDDTVSDEGETEHDLSGLIQDAEKPVESVLDTKKAVGLTYMLLYR